MREWHARRLGAESLSKPCLLSGFTASSLSQWGAWLNDLQDQSTSEFKENTFALPAVVTLNVKWPSPLKEVLAMSYHCSVAESCLAVCDPLDPMPGSSDLHHFLEFAQIHVHWVSDAIQPSHPMSPSSAFNISQHQGFFQWVSCLHQVAKVLELQLQHQSFQWIFRVDFLWLVPCSSRNSQESSPTSQFESISSSWSSAVFMVQLSHPYILEKP